MCSLGKKVAEWRLDLSFDRSSFRVGFLAGTLGRGGAERQLIYMLRALQNEGLNARVLCLTKGEAFEQEILDLGVKLEYVGSSRNNVVRLNKIIGSLRRERVDVIQSVHFYTNIYSALSARAVGVTSIGAIRSELTSEISANGIFGRWHLNLPSMLVANSQIGVDRAIAAGIDATQVRLVRNAVDNGTDQASLKRDHALNLLFAGRLVPPKRPELFIELAAALREKHPKRDLNFLIAGDGPLRASLERLATAKGFEGRGMTFLGEQANMSELYQKSDILVLTSGHEGTPNVVLEAMAHGLPVVATRVGGVSEIVVDSCGFCVDPADFSELVEATSILIVDPELRAEIGRNGRDFVRKNHSIDYLQRELTAVYSRIVKTNN